MKFSSTFLPLDLTIISTRVAIHPDFFGKPKDYILSHDMEVRNLKPGKGPRSPIHLDVLTFKGIVVDVYRELGEPLARLVIKFNPGKCLYGHNGRIISLSEFLDALGLLVHHLRPMLKDPADWVHLLPGITREGRAYWHMLEIPLQLHERDGFQFEHFRHLHYKRRKPARHWKDSLSIGANNSDLRFCIYRKPKEMKSHGVLPEERLADFDGILRLEARFKGKKLLEYVGNDRNTEIIDGKERLVRFFPADLVGAIRTAFEGIEGVCHQELPAVSSDGKKLVALARMLAQVASDPRCTFPFPKLVATLARYTGTTSSQAIRDIRGEGLAGFSRRSPLSFDEVFSGENFNRQFGIAVAETEHRVRHPSRHIFSDAQIVGAYQPPDQVELIAGIPSYFH